MLYKYSYTKTLDFLNTYIRNDIDNYFFINLMHTIALLPTFPWYTFYSTVFIVLYCIVTVTWRYNDRKKFSDTEFGPNLAEVCNTPCHSGRYHLGTLFVSYWWAMQDSRYMFICRACKLHWSTIYTYISRLLNRTKQDITFHCHLLNVENYGSKSFLFNNRF